MTTGASDTVALDTPTDTPLLTAKPVAVTSAFGCALALTLTSRALTVEPDSRASTVGLTVADTTDPAAAAEMSPYEAAVASTRATAVATTCALMTRSPVTVTVLDSTKARVAVVTFAEAEAPPPDSETLSPAEADTAAACDTAVIEADSMACTVMLPVVLTVAERTKARTSLPMLLLVSATPMAAEPPTSPTDPETDAAKAGAVIVEVSCAVMVRPPMPATTPAPREPST